ISETCPCVMPAVETNAAVIDGMINHIKDQCTILVNVQQRANSLDGNQVVLIPAIDEIVFSQDSMLGLMHSDEPAIPPLTVHREPVIMACIKVAKDHANGSIIRRAYIETKPVVSPIAGLLRVVTWEGRVVSTYEHRPRLHRVCAVEHAVPDPRSLYDGAQRR